MSINTMLKLSLDKLVIDAGIDDSNFRALAGSICDAAKKTRLLDLSFNSVVISYFRVFSEHTEERPAGSFRRVCAMRRLYMAKEPNVLRIILQVSWS